MIQIMTAFLSKLAVLSSRSRSRPWSWPVIVNKTRSGRPAATTTSSTTAVSKSSRSPWLWQRQLGLYCSYYVAAAFATTTTNSSSSILSKFGQFPTATATSAVDASRFYSSSSSSSSTTAWSSSVQANNSHTATNNNTALQLLESLSRRLQESPTVFLTRRGDPATTGSTTSSTTRSSKRHQQPSKSTSSSSEKRRMVELATEFCTSYENLPPIKIPIHNATVDDIDYCQRTSILKFLASKCRPTETSINHAIEHYQNTMMSHNNNSDTDPNNNISTRHWDHLVEELRRSVTPPYEEIVNFILKQNSVTGMKFLVALREDLSYVNSFLKNQQQGESSSSSSNRNSITNCTQQFKQFDSHLKNVFKTWFTPGMMELRRIEYDKTPASIIETIATKEQVHPMRSLDDLRSRLGQGRRVFGLFHPLLPDVPLIFVHVALLQEIPSKMQDVMIENTKNRNIPPQSLSTSDETHHVVACFYSISNGQKALSGLGLGEYLIKQATQELKREIPSLQTFVTLSPIPRFRKWLETKLNLQDHDFENSKGENPFFDDTILSDDEKQSLIDCGLLSALDDNGGGDANKISWGSFWRLLTDQIDFSTQFQPGSSESETSPTDRLDDRQRTVLKSILTKLTTRYLCCEKHHGRPLDAVCNFHVGNGAIVHRVNPIADPSRRGLESSFGMMVNYLYDLETVNDNQASFEYDYSIPVSPEVQECIDSIKW